MRSWPFEQANIVVSGVSNNCGYVRLQTGFGPSGHFTMGTIGEIIRTSMVRTAIHALVPDAVSYLTVFSDDYDALRRRPEDMPVELDRYLGYPLSQIPDLLGSDQSYADHNNQELMRMVHRVSLPIITNQNGDACSANLVSSTEMYRTGQFNNGLLNVISHYDEIMDIMLPSVGPDRRATYSPFLPISPTSGRVLQTPILSWDRSGVISFHDEDGTLVENFFVGNGNTKLQWKVDWAMRWSVLKPDYEMSGKDLIELVKLSSKIVRVLGGKPPVNLTYELFLDEDGRKISKSLGNGLAVGTWLSYSNPESMKFFMFQNPKAAKRLHLGMIPVSTDDYLKQLVAYQIQTPEAQMDNPVWHIHGGHPPKFKSDVTYTLLLNLASAAKAIDRDTLEAILAQYRSVSEDDLKVLRPLFDGVLAYCRDHVFPNRVCREPTEQERLAILNLVEVLTGMDDGLDAEAYQYEVYEVGKAYAFEPLGAWFKALYGVLFGAESGPRFGTFIAAYGRARTIEFIQSMVH